MILRNTSYEQLVVLITCGAPGNLCSSSTPLPPHTHSDPDPTFCHLGSGSNLDIEFKQFCYSRIFKINAIPPPHPSVYDFLLSFWWTFSGQMNSDSERQHSYKIHMFPWFLVSLPLLFSTSWVGNAWSRAERLDVILDYFFPPCFPPCLAVVCFLQESMETFSFFWFWIPTHLSRSGIFLGVKFPKIGNFGRVRACRTCSKIFIFKKSQGP